ncbi:MAG: hypothetical protein EBT83_03675 [Betaproteobacteria bacterium]|nr:hypothetical protein [Betaproteobacteria bacterium]
MTGTCYCWEVILKKDYISIVVVLACFTPLVLLPIWYVENITMFFFITLKKELEDCLTVFLSLILMFSGTLWLHVTDGILYFLFQYFNVQVKVILKIEKWIIDN